MTRVLVTGASTPVGAAVVAQLVREARVEAVLAVQRPHEKSVGLEELPNVRLAYADLTHYRQIHDLLFGEARRMGCDTVLHLAAHRAAREEGNRIHALNVESTRQLLELAQRHPTLRHFVLRSYAEVYRVRPHHPTLLREEHPLELSPSAPQWVRDRVESDLIACSAMGVSDLRVAVLRCAECPAAGNGSQLWEYLQARLCFTPLGFDPMINLISIPDMADALTRIALSSVVGVYNVPGADTLPLSEAIRCAGRPRIPVPDRFVARLQALGGGSRGNDFRYDQNHFRFRFSGVLDGTRIRNAVGYVPRQRIGWNEVKPHSGPDTSAAQVGAHQRAN